MRILILGSSGMLGHTLLHCFSGRHEVFGSQRALASPHIESAIRERILPGLDLKRPEYLHGLLDQVRPQVVINCVGVIKQFKETARKEYIDINSQLPHVLAELTAARGMRMVHFSTDCVFDGQGTNYSEADPPTAKDDYGLSKYLGEVIDTPSALTLRTSIIGHEIGRSLSLIDWFLTQNGSVKGFTKAIYSGLPTVVVAEVLEEILVNHPTLGGLYHLSSAPISKFELLGKVAQRYKKDIKIVPNEDVRIDRSLDSSRLRKLVPMNADNWDQLVAKMHDFFMLHQALYRPNGSSDADLSR